ncbi:MAG: extracellular solute-binding protein, partial [Clostridia bacterium]|nr:extracellular solute-binding protein [Clostridia bacterium]
MKSFKRILASFICLSLMFALFTACGQTETTDDAQQSETDQQIDTDQAEQETDPDESDGNKELTGTLTFWHFNSDEGPALARAFEKAYPGVTVKDQITADTDGNYQTKVQSASRSGDLPDVYAAENAFVKRFVDMPGGYRPLDFPDVDQVTSKLVPYTLEIGTNLNGEL